MSSVAGPGVDRFTGMKLSVVSLLLGSSDKVRNWLDELADTFISIILNWSPVLCTDCINPSSKFLSFKQLAMPHEMIRVSREVDLIDSFITGSFVIMNDYGCQNNLEVNGFCVPCAFTLVLLVVYSV